MASPRYVIRDDDQWVYHGFSPESVPGTREALIESSNDFPDNSFVKGFYKVNYDRDVLNLLMHNFIHGNKNSADMFQGVNDDNQTELLALRKELEDDSLTFQQFDWNSNCVPMYVSDQGHIWTTHPLAVNPKFDQKALPCLFVTSFNLVLSYSALLIGLYPEHEKLTVLTYSDTNEEVVSYLWEMNRMIDGVQGILFTDHADIAYPGLKYYSTRFQRQSVIPRDSLARTCCRLRLVSQKAMNVNFRDQFETMLQTFANYAVDIGNMFPFDQLIHSDFHVAVAEIEFPCDNTLGQLETYAMPQISYSSHATCHSIFWNNMFTLLPEEMKLAGKGLAVIFSDSPDESIRSMLALGSLDFGAIAVMDFVRNTVSMTFSDTSIEALQVAVGENEQAIVNSLMPIHRDLDSQACVYNGFVWATARKDGFLELHKHVGITPVTMHQNCQYLLNPFIACNLRNSDKFCHSNVNWKVGPGILVPVSHNRFVVLKDICDESRLKVQNGPLLSDGANTFLSSILKYYNDMGKGFNTTTELAEHFVKILGLCFARTFYVGPGKGDINNHSLADLPMINDSRLHILNEAPHNICSITECAVHKANCTLL
ncbi:hypothetical protein HDE_12924 [Halotydeus destructor]|nr:hypothetical protein HDE_12924 [Halotydeus destructor]